MGDKVHIGRLGDALEVESGGALVLKSGATLDMQSGSRLLVDGAAPAALTAQLTTITPADAAGTPDYAIAAVTNSSPYGFSNAAEVITLLYVIKNLQVRLAEVEARLEAAGLVTAN